MLQLVITVQEGKVEVAASGPVNTFTAVGVLERAKQALLRQLDKEKESPLKLANGSLPPGMLNPKRN